MIILCDIISVMVNFKQHTDKFIVLAVTLICGIACFFGVMQKFDFRLYDLLLSFKDDSKTRSEVVLVDIDDASLDKLGAWPWSRKIYADMLVRLKELGAMLAVFDIEYLSPSNPSVNPELEGALKNSFAKSVNSNASSQMFFDSVKDSIFMDYDDLFARSVQFFGNTWLTINTGQICEYSMEDLEYAKSRFLFDVDDPKNLILKGNIKTRFDVEGKSFFEKRALNNIDFTKFTENAVTNDYVSEISPAMNLFISHAVGAGFTNSFIDSDGSRRRVELLSFKGDGCVSQLVFAPMLSLINPEKIVRTNNTLEILGANIPEFNSDSEIEKWAKKDISIPLDDDGRMFVNWKHSDFTDSFRHEPFFFISQLDDFEDNIYRILQELSSDAWNGSEYVSYRQKAAALCSSYSDILEYKKYILSICEGFDADGNAIFGGVPKEVFDEYFALRKTFFENVTSLTATYKENEIAELEAFLNENIEFFGDNAAIEIKAWVMDDFDKLKSDVQMYNEKFADAHAFLKNAFCIIGNTASGTTDLGTNPFSRAYPNVGMHANVYNTILTEEFITPLDWRFGVILAGILTLILVGFVPSKKAFVHIFAGIFLIVIVAAIPVCLMVMKGYYLPAMSPILIATLSFLIATTYRFMTAEKDKAFLKNTFGAYVSPDVVNEIVKNPDVARLGGKTDELTALFSDVKTFSGFTEVINNEERERVKKENAALPERERKSDEEVELLGAAKGAERLVAILNEYLGVLSDAIMAEGGTIDKYVGDEIVSFFGAPVPDKNNAFNACVAGIRMLQAEAKYNAEHSDKLPINPQTGKPFYLHSRVGLNTGNMVVGNMGTDKKLNYTIMGNNVNLASRLEGTNKAYGSWMMVSESTWVRANSGENKGKLIARIFDAVRVVNVKKPVRIVNILGLRSELSEAQIKAAEAFNEGMKWYMKGCDTPTAPKDPEDFKKAYALYKKAKELYPDDESSQVFMDRCADFMKNGTRGDWDGVYTMTSK